SPAWRLLEALRCIKDPATDRILIEGFYDAIEPASDDDMAEIAKYPMDEAFILDDFGAKTLIGGVRGVDASRQYLFSPSCNISGLTAGYQGPGMKSVLPAEASAKVDMRLVPWQDAHDIYAKLRAHLDKHGFEDVETELV